MKEKKNMPIYDVEGGTCKAVFLKNRLASGFNIKRIKKLLAPEE